MIQVQPRHAPQAGVDRGRRALAVDEPVARKIPKGSAARAANHPLVVRADEAAARIGEVRRVVERQELLQLRVHAACRSLGVLPGAHTIIVSTRGVTSRKSTPE